MMLDNAKFLSCSNTWLEHLPGMSSLGATELAEFKLSFLSSIYSGILSGIVTGLIVGLVIYGFHKGFEKRKLKTSLDREISIFKEKARVFLGKSVVYELNDLRNAPEYVKQILELIESNPLDVWKEHLRNIHGELSVFMPTLEDGETIQHQKAAIMRWLGINPQEAEN